MHWKKGCVQVHIFLNKRQLKSLMYTCCNLVSLVTRVTHVNNRDVVNIDITKGLINPETLNWWNSMKLKSIKSISQYAAKKQSPPSLECHSPRTFSGAIEVPPLAPSGVGSWLAVEGVGFLLKCWFLVAFVVESGEGWELWSGDEIKKNDKEE